MAPWEIGLFWKNKFMWADIENKGSRLPLQTDTEGESTIDWSIESTTHRTGIKKETKQTIRYSKMHFLWQNWPHCQLLLPQEKNAGDFLTKNQKVNSLAIVYGDTDVSDIPEEKEDESDKNDEFLTKKISEQLSALRCGESSREEYHSDDESYSQLIAALAEKQTFLNSWQKQNWILLFQDRKEVRNCRYQNTDGRFFHVTKSKRRNELYFDVSTCR
jgi:hypothetical protein